MKQLDLDDLPPKVAQILAGMVAGETLALVRDGLVVGRLTGTVAEEAPHAMGGETVAGASPVGEARAAEIFEQFRSLMEDDF